jgi:hypothetical protein
MATQRTADGVYFDQQGRGAAAWPAVPRWCAACAQPGACVPCPCH